MDYSPGVPNEAWRTFTWYVDSFMHRFLLDFVVTCCFTIIIIIIIINNNLCSATFNYGLLGVPYARRSICFVTVHFYFFVLPFLTLCSVTTHAKIMYGTNYERSCLRSMESFHISRPNCRASKKLVKKPVYIFGWVQIMHSLFQTRTRGKN